MHSFPTLFSSVAWKGRGDGGGERGGAEAGEREAVEREAVESEVVERGRWREVMEDDKEEQGGVGAGVGRVREKERRLSFHIPLVMPVSPSPCRRVDIHILCTKVYSICNRITYWIRIVGEVNLNTSDIVQHTVPSSPRVLFLPPMRSPTAKCPCTTKHCSKYKCVMPCAPSTQPCAHDTRSPAQHTSHQHHPQQHIHVEGSLVSPRERRSHSVRQSCSQQWNKVCTHLHLTLQSFTPTTPALHLKSSQTHVPHCKAHIIIDQ